MAIVIDGTSGLTYTGDSSGAQSLSVPQSVGIGTTSPGARLEVKGSSSDNATININNNSGNIWKLWNDNGASALNIQYNGSTKVVVDSSGNMGIGTTSPSSKLYTQLSSATAYSSGVTGNGLTIYNSSATTNQYVGITLQGEPTTGNGGIATIMGTTTGSGNMDLTFSTRGSATLAERMRIDSSGNVGIGTTTLTNKLNVAGAVQSSAILTAVAVNTIAMSQESSYGRIAAFGPNATTAGTLYLYVIDSAGGNQRGMVIASDGQLYHNSTYLVGTAYNHYWAKSTTAISPVSSGWTDVALQWSNVYIPTNVKKVLLTFHITFRNNGIAVNHSGFRMKVTNTSNSAVTYVGDASWGFGISQCVGNTSGQNHMTVSQHVNLLDYDSSGNQATLAAGSTYNMMLQVIDAYGNGTTLRLAAEAGAAHATYTPAHGSIWII